jgi:hypothetical protein
MSASLCLTNMRNYGKWKREGGGKLGVWHLTSARHSWKLQICDGLPLLPAAFHGSPPDGHSCAPLGDRSMRDGGATGGWSCSGLWQRRELEPSRYLQRNHERRMVVVAAEEYAKRFTKYKLSSTII